MLKKLLNRLRRKHKIKTRISRDLSIPRLSVFRSNTNIYAQIIDDKTWTTLVSSNDLKLEKKLTKTENAIIVWEDLAKKAISMKIEKVVFDRGGFLYHWRVKALADSARKNWLKF